MASAPTDREVGEALAHFHALHPRKIDLSLGRIKRVLKKLGHPERKLPPTVHIAGTNGKGSTLAFLRAMAEAEGLKVHSYISPHLVRFNERITLAGEEIDNATLLDVLERVSDANGREPLTFFEATTAAAYLAFSEHPADLAIIEVGLGGLYDATNVIQPVLSLITPISKDHQDFLGSDIAGIAREKAGIMKRHTQVITGRQTELVDAVLDAEARKYGAPIRQWGQDFRAYTQGGRLVYEDETQLIDLPLPNLTGIHQIDNGGLAVAAALHLQLSHKAIARGLERAHWPARMQPITSGPLYTLAQGVGAELWLDGGHNPDAGKVIAETLAGLEAKAPKPLILIGGLLKTKDAQGWLQNFAGLAHSFIAVPIDGHDSYAPDDLADMALGLGMAADTAPNISHAVRAATDIVIPDGTGPRIVIAGSLYLAGRVLEISEAA